VRGLPSSFAAALSLIALGCTAGPTQPPLRQPSARGEADSAKKHKHRKGAFSARHRLKLAQRCGHRCVYRQTGGSQLSLELAPGGVATADDQGELAEHFRSVIGTTHHDTAWHRTWKGEWREGGESVQLTLEPDLTDCTRRSGDGQPEAACKPSKLTLTCVPTTVITRAKRREAEPSWVCSPAAPQQATGQTPFPWVFGMDHALVMVDRGAAHQPRRFYHREGARKHRKHK
jgi:hypothetical protein